MPTLSISLARSLARHVSVDIEPAEHVRYCATMQYWWDVFIFILCSSTPCTSTSVPTWCVCVVWNFECASACVLLLFVSVFVFFGCSIRRKIVFPHIKRPLSRTHGQRIRVCARPPGFFPPIDLNWNKTNSCNMHLIASIIYTKPTT